MESKKQSDKINEILTKIKGIKNIKLIIGILAVAILMLLYSGFVESKKNNETAELEKVTENKSYDSYDDEEEKLADILSEIEGIGQTKVMISYDENRIVKGVIVVAEGANEPLSEWKIRHAVQTALKIDYQSIEVYSMK